MEKKWWHKKIVYQIYPRSFMDSNNDGIGDLKGIIQKLDYLKDLGIELVWLSPVFSSPNDDNGYDISDYRNIMSEFGTMDDMDLLLSKAKEKGIQIILDLVANHTSDEHAWFIESRKSKDNPYRDYYIWRDGKKDTPPNEIGSAFGGSAWAYDETTKQYYLHIFSKKQPDLNWANETVRNEVYDFMNFWIEKGIAGFRMDVIELIGKEPDLMITSNGPNLHPYLKEMHQKTFGPKDLITVGECWGASVDIAKAYTKQENKELSMIFSFEHVSLDQQPGKEKWDLQPYDFMAFKASMEKWQTGCASEGWNTLFWENHDLPRIVSRLGNEKQYWKESAKMLALAMHGLKGTPYIYQGEELGMTNVSFADISDYNDIEIKNMYKERISKGYAKEDVMHSIYAKGRDNARTPMQWDDSSQAGFTKGIPWLKVNPNYKQINAANQIKDETSIYTFYKKLIALRKELELLTYGDFHMILKEDEDIFAYQRTYQNQVLTVFCNFHEKTKSIDCLKQLKQSNNKKTTCILCSYDQIPTKEKMDVFRPYEARMYLQE